jgi:hypothetical protein
VNTAPTNPSTHPLLKISRFSSKQGEIQKQSAKMYVSIQGGGGREGGQLKTKSFLVVNIASSSLLRPRPLSFSGAPPLLLLHIYFHCSYMYNYYNYSRTLCIKCRVSAYHIQI